MTVEWRGVQWQTNVQHELAERYLNVKRAYQGATVRASWTGVDQMRHIERTGQLDRVKRLTRVNETDRHPLATSGSFLHTLYIGRGPVREWSACQRAAGQRVEVNT